MIHPEEIAFSIAIASAYPRVLPLSTVSVFTALGMWISLNNAWRRSSLFMWARWIRGPASATVAEKVTTTPLTRPSNPLPDLLRSSVGGFFV